MSLKGTEDADNVVKARKVAEELRLRQIEPYEIQEAVDRNGNPATIKRPTMEAFETVCYDLFIQRAETNDLRWQLDTQHTAYNRWLFLCIFVCIAICAFINSAKEGYVDNGLGSSDIACIFIGVVIGIMITKSRFHNWRQKVDSKDEELLSAVLAKENALRETEKSMKAEELRVRRECEQKITRMKEAMRENDKNVKAEEARVRWECERNEERRIKRSDMMAQYHGKPVRFLFPIPSHMSVADGGFPVVKGWKREDYWVYVTPEGKCYHRKNCGSVYYGAESVRIWDIPWKYFPCLKCHPKNDNFTWYNQMRDLEKELRRFGFRMDIRNETMYLVDLETQPQSPETS